MRVLGYLFAGLCLIGIIGDGDSAATQHFATIAAIMFVGAWLKDEIDELKERL